MPRVRESSRKRRFKDEVFPGAFAPAPETYEEHLKALKERGIHEYECRKCNYIWTSSFGPYDEGGLLPVCPRCG